MNQEINHSIGFKLQSQLNKRLTYIALCVTMIVVILPQISHLQMLFQAPTINELFYINPNLLSTLHHVLLICFLFIAVSLSERLGFKMVMQMGLLLFMLALLYILFKATNNVEMAVCFLLLGIGVGLVLPCSVSLLVHTYKTDKHPKLIAIWGGLIGFFILFRSLMTLLIFNNSFWQIILYIVCLLSIVCLVINQANVIEVRNKYRRNRSTISTLLMSLISCSFYIIFTTGLIGVNWCLLVAVVVLSIAFIIWERKTSRPLLVKNLFSSKHFYLPMLAIIVSCIGFTCIYILLQHYVGINHRIGMFETIFMYSLTMLAYLITSIVAAQIGKITSQRFIVFLGIIVMAITCLFISNVAFNLSYTVLICSSILLMIGSALAFIPSLIKLFDRADIETIGLISSMFFMTKEIAAVFGVAIFGQLNNAFFSFNVNPMLNDEVSTVQLKESSFSLLPYLHEVILAMNKSEDSYETIIYASQVSLSGTMLVAGIVFMIAACILFYFYPKRKTS